jgi:hypothetical protein
LFEKKPCKIIVCPKIKFADLETKEKMAFCSSLGIHWDDHLAVLSGRKFNTFRRRYNLKLEHLLDIDHIMCVVNSFGLSEQVKVIYKMRLLYEEKNDNDNDAEVDQMPIIAAKMYISTTNKLVLEMFKSFALSITGAEPSDSEYTPIINHKKYRCYGQQLPDEIVESIKDIEMMRTYKRPSRLTSGVGFTNRQDPTLGSVPVSRCKINESLLYDL